MHDLTELDAGSIVFIGGGQMATAIIEGLLNAAVPNSAVVVVEPDPAQRARLRERFKIQVVERATTCDKNPLIAIWSVKPQMMRTAISQSLPYLPGSLHLSIAAGLRCSTLCTWLHSERVIRAMPNTSSLIAAGVTGLVAAPRVTEEDKRLTEALLQAIGHYFWVDDDERLDAVTAVSGSGPAYVFHFLEAFQLGAQALGFDEEEARALVLKTAAGALKQADRGEAFSTLRERVTSRGGTTEAALRTLDGANTKDTIQAAVEAAFLRAIELSKELARENAKV